MFCTVNVNPIHSGMRVALKRAGHRHRRQKTNHGTSWKTKFVDDSQLLVTLGIPHFTPRRPFPLPCHPRPPTITNELSTLPCLTPILPPPHRPLTSNWSSIMPWTNTRNLQRTTYSPIPSPPPYKLAILPATFSLFFVSKSRV